MLYPLGIHCKHDSHYTQKPLKGGVRSQFVELLEKLIDARYKSRRAFIRAANPKGNENADQAYLAAVLRDKRPKPAPLDRLPMWAEALGLAGIHRQHFMDLASIDHLPADLRPRFLSILSGFEKADAREQLQQAAINKRDTLINELESRITALEAQAKRRGK